MHARHRFFAAALATGLGLTAGCGSSPAPAPVAEQPAAEAPAVVAVPATDTKTVPVVAVVTTQPVQAPAPAAPPPAPFRFPTDVGGKVIAATLTPAAPPAPAFGKSTAPRTRSSDIERGELPLPKVAVKIPVLPQPPAKVARPSPSVEGVPLFLGQAAAQDPGAIKMTEKLPVKAQGAFNPRATDVPKLAQQLPDRAPTDDPTVDLSTARLVFTDLPAPFNVAWFVRFGIPDPFELVEQMRGKTGATGELGAGPVAVPPARP
ncbi:hypothetical protein [Fimbriiglobus ruber]|uniref:Uncharacterized protein n=1 Tax=Fimbriiglobus ruber TaxID=1908690 RepID=A0A225DMH5_9BACT|nr:hypothetical protein [Fimbriiglobus ruber]OWK38656.1 hypothetical protein FRUB_07776 [Fimbriiglobus ruber]